MQRVGDLYGDGGVGAPSVENEGWQTPVWGVGDPCVGWEPTLRGMGGVGDLPVEDGGWETPPYE